jgi:hypothetical protein
VAASTTLVNIHPIVMLLLSRSLGERINKATVAGVLVATEGAWLERRWGPWATWRWRMEPRRLSR